MIRFFSYDLTKAHFKVESKLFLQKSVMKHHFLQSGMTFSALTSRLNRFGNILFEVSSRLRNKVVAFYAIKSVIKKCLSTITAQMKPTKKLVKCFLPRIFSRHGKSKPCMAHVAQPSETEYFSGLRYCFKRASCEWHFIR